MLHASPSRSMKINLWSEDAELRASYTRSPALTLWCGHASVWVHGEKTSCSGGVHGFSVFLVDLTCSYDCRVDRDGW